MIIKQLIRAGLIALCVVAAPLAAKAQPLVTQATTPSSFDGYRALAITAGVVAGAVVAAVITDGLIIPVLAATTGGAEVGAGAAAMAGAAGPAGAGAGGMQAGMVARAGGYGYGLLRGTLRVFGAIGGGMYADSMYLNR
jgi:hypothetical protein